jgi:hypothetical protein
MATNLGAKNSYKRVTVNVTEIGDKAVWINGTPVGRSLLAHISDEKLTAYRGPLPMEFALEIVSWRVNKGDL